MATVLGVARVLGPVLLALACIGACSSDDETLDRNPTPKADAGSESGVLLEGGTFPEAGDGDVYQAPCPAEMVLVAQAPVTAFCMDRYEAPNVAGGLPLVMYSFVEAEAWCQARDKRLCFDDEWTFVCAGDASSKYPYGDQHKPGVCNDDETWLAYDQAKLNGWPANAASPELVSLAALLKKAKQYSAAAAIASDHVKWLYQAEPSGQNGSCTNEKGAFDLVGNVEEWTRRRSGGSKDFHGNLKGRYWADTRTCQNSIITHGDGFRFYEIGFRCCKEPATSNAD